MGRCLLFMLKVVNTEITVFSAFNGAVKTNPNGWNPSLLHTGFFHTSDLLSLLTIRSFDGPFSSQEFINRYSSHQISLLTFFMTSTDHWLCLLTLFQSSSPITKLLSPSLFLCLSFCLCHDIVLTYNKEWGDSITPWNDITTWEEFPP